MAHAHPPGALSERESKVLLLTVLYHIRTGEPVGSRFLSRRLDVELSPATIRNIMADLEERGFLRQTHASSGRVPTDTGYRYYVDELVEGGPARPQGIEALRERFRPQASGITELIRETSRALSDATRHAGLVLGPRLGEARLQRLEFRRVAERRVLAIFVTEHGLVQTRLIELAEDWSQAELDAMGRICNGRFSALTLREIRARIAETLAEDRAALDTLAQRALALGREALGGGGEEEDPLYLDGAANILDAPEFGTPEKMRALLRAIEEKGRLCLLLDQCLRAGGVRVCIGGELPLPGLQDLSLVTAPYRRGGRVLGVLGVIGPTRMEYARIIPIVECAASTLSECLSRG